MQLIKGGILTDISSEKKVLVLHGCNCFHTMGAGIAKYLRNKFSKVYLADVTQTVNADYNKLGTYSVARISENFHILNCYTQYAYGGKKDVDYEAIKRYSKRFLKTIQKIG